MANITTSEVSNSLATIIAAQALGRLQTNAVLANLVARDWDTDVATYGQTVRIPVRGALSVNDKAANTDYTLQTPSDTAVDVTLNKHKEVSFVIEDLARALARPDLLQGYIDDGMIALGEQIDQDLAALYATLTGSVDASSTAGPLDTPDFIEARRQLSVAKAPMADRYAVLHPTAMAEALNIEKFTNRDFRVMGDEPPLVNPQFVLGNFGGFLVIEDQNIAEVSTLQRNLFFQKNAMVLVTRPLPSPEAGTGVLVKTMSENGVGLRVQISYQHLKGGHLVTIDCLYGVKVLRAGLGVVVKTD